MKTAIVVTIAALLVLFTIVPSPALGWTASSLTLLTGANVPVLGSDGLWNYDFKSQTASSTNVDFPVTMLYGLNATKWTIRGLYWGEATNHTTMYGRLKDSSSYVWNGDKGTRSNNTWYPVGTHMRMYAANDSYMYNQYLGKYVVGTTHYDDYQEFGWSETCEEEMAQIARNKGCLVEEDLLYFYNYEPYRIEQSLLEKHVWYNNGYASEVCIS